MESSGSVPSAIAPKCTYEEMASTADQRLMLTKSESEARFIARLLIERAGESADFKHLANLIEHGLHELRTRIVPRRDDGDFSDEINDRLVKEAFEDAPKTAAAPATPTSESLGPGLADAIERFLAEQRPAVSQKTLLDYDQTFRLAQDFWGNEIPVDAIKKAAARDFKDLLLKLPANMTQRFPGKTLQEAVQEGAKAGVATISPKTINKNVNAGEILQQLAGAKVQQ